MTTSNGDDDRRTLTSRRRSLSVASGAPTVDTVIDKAKRAASTIWILLHAQNCVVATGQCPHAGCQEAKLLHLHLKTCPAGSEFGCPQTYHGCDQARKLLSHYRRCRSMRARQSSTGRRELGHQHCLVCSLVARHARNVLEVGSGTRLPKAAPSASSCRQTRGVTSFTIETLNEVLVESPSTSAKHMPPPPPRLMILAPDGAMAMAGSMEFPSSRDDVEVKASKRQVSIDEEAMMFEKERSDSFVARRARSASQGDARNVGAGHEDVEGRPRSVSVGGISPHLDGVAQTIFEEASQGSRDSVERDWDVA